MNHKPLTIAQRPLDELHVPPSYVNRRIEGPTKSTTKLIGENYRKLSKELDERGALELNDAEKTAINLLGIQRKWNKYALHLYRNCCTKLIHTQVLRIY